MRIHAHGPVVNDLERPARVEVLPACDAELLQRRLAVRAAGDLERREERFPRRPVDLRPPAAFALLGSRVNVAILCGASRVHWHLDVINP